MCPPADDRREMDVALCRHVGEARRPSTQAPGRQAVSARGIEVGPIFYFGTKYPPMKRGHGADGASAPCTWVPRDRAERLVAAIIEPSTTMPASSGRRRSPRFKVAILNLKQARPNRRRLRAALPWVTAKASMSSMTTATSGRARNSRRRPHRIPWQVLIGPKGLAEGRSGQAPGRRQPRADKLRRRGRTVIAIIVRIGRMGRSPWRETPESLKIDGWEDIHGRSDRDHASLRRMDAVAALSARAPAEGLSRSSPDSRSSASCWACRPSSS